MKNKYINAVLKMLIFSASLHMALLFYLALSRGDLYILNYFNIMDFDILFPAIFKNNFWGNLISFIVVLIIYAIFLKISDNKNSKDGK